MTSQFCCNGWLGAPTHCGPRTSNPRDLSNAGPLDWNAVSDYTSLNPAVVVVNACCHRFSDRGMYYDPRWHITVNNGGPGPLHYGCAPLAGGYERDVILQDANPNNIGFMMNPMQQLRVWGIGLKVTNMLQDQNIQVNAKFTVGGNVYEKILNFKYDNGVAVAWADNVLAQFRDQNIKIELNKPRDSATCRFVHDLTVNGFLAGNNVGGPINSPALSNNDQTLDITTGGIGGNFGLTMWHISSWFDFDRQRTYYGYLAHLRCEIPRCYACNNFENGVMDDTKLCKKKKMGGGGVYSCYPNGCKIPGLTCSLKMCDCQFTAARNDVINKKQQCINANRECRDLPNDDSLLCSSYGAGWQMCTLNIRTGAAAYGNDEFSAVNPPPHSGFYCGVGPNDDCASCKTKDLAEADNHCSACRDPNKQLLEHPNDNGKVCVAINANQQANDNNGGNNVGVNANLNACNNRLLRRHMTTNQNGCKTCGRCDYEKKTFSKWDKFFKTEMSYGSNEASDTADLYAYVDYDVFHPWFKEFKSIQYAKEDALKKGIEAYYAGLDVKVFQEKTKRYKSQGMSSTAAAENAFADMEGPSQSSSSSVSASSTSSSTKSTGQCSKDADCSGNFCVKSTGECCPANRSQWDAEFKNVVECCKYVGCP